MNDASIREMIKYRLQQARETLGEAEALYQMSFWRGTINRSYYAMFHAVLALAVLRQTVTSKHSGVIAFFDREFVRAGVSRKNCLILFTMLLTADKLLIMEKYLL